MDAELDPVREEKLEKILNQYDKINEIIIDSCEQLGMQVCVAIHVRDPLNRSKAHPDWFGMHLIAKTCTEFQKALFINMVQHFFAYWFHRDGLDEWEE